MAAGSAGPAFASEIACPTFEESSVGLPETREWRTHPSVGDVNGDGHLDVAGHPRKGKAPGVFFGNGKGSFEEKSLGLLIPGGTCGVGTDFGDLNADGHLDLLVADHCRGIHVFLGNGKGIWRFLPEPLGKSGRLGVDDAQFGDVDGDGHLDIVAIGGFRGGFVLLRGDGKGGFENDKTSGLPVNGYGPDVKLADVNGDDRLDVIAPFTAEGRGAFTDGEQEGRKLPVVWLGGKDGFGDASSGIPDEGNFRGTAIGDVNGDGHMDLAISAGRWEDRPPLLVYLGDGSGAQWRAAPEQPTTGGDPVTEGIEFADLNGDGALDLVAVTHLDAGLRVWMGRGDGRFQACGDSGLPSERTDIRGWGLAIGQIAGDERPDIVVGVGRSGQGAIEVWAQK